MIKQFNPPSFEIWCKRGHNYEETLGAYTCAICEWASGRAETTYILKVAASPVPTNINVDSIISRAYTCNYAQSDAKQQLWQWYEDTVNWLREQWTQYMTETYLSTVM